MIYIDLIGLVNVFDRGTEGKVLLLPDGTQPALNIPPHLASIVVVEAQLIGNENWEPENDSRLDDIQVKSFRIDPPSEIVISGIEVDKRSSVDAKGWTGLVPLLRGKNLHIVPEKAATVAQIKVGRGKLEAFFFADDSVAGRLTINSPGDLTITAKDADGKPKTLTLFDGAEIVIANLSRRDSALPNPNADPDSHFRLYGQLDENRRSTDLTVEPERDARLQHLPSGHPYLAFIRANGGAFPTPGCSVTGGP